ncbi:MAG: outer membrane protein assembly factor BamD [Gemmatimonadota bacterium]
MIQYVPIFLLLALTACGGPSNRYQGMDAPALFIMAQQEADEGDIDNAIRTLDRLLLAHGDWTGVADARLFLGELYFEKEEYLTAASEYRRFLDRYPGHPRAADAALGRCRAFTELAPRPERDQTFTQQALIECGNTAADFAGMPQADEAADLAGEMRATLAEKDYLNGRFYLRRNIPDSAIKYFEFVVERYPDTEYAPLALLGIYHANMAIGYDDLADEARDRLLARYPDSEAASELGPDGSTG